MDPVTGLSRRSLVALAAAVALGVVASTVATVYETAAEGACSDPAYGCVAFVTGEPVQVALVVPREGLAPMDVPSSLQGRPVIVHELPVGCSVEAAAAAAREIATDPPDAPPFLAAVSATCPAAGIPLAQILDDSGIALVVAGEPPPVPAAVGFTLVGAELPGAASLILEVAGRVAFLDSGAILVPRTPLRDGLLEAGLTRLDPERPLL